MSSEAMAWAMRQRVGSPAAKFVLITMADGADEQFEVGYRPEELMRITELDLGGLERAVAHLVTGRFLIAKDNPGKPGPHQWYLLGVEFQG